MTHPTAPARFIWNWNSLVGCVQGALQAFGHPHDAAWVSGALGEAFRGVPASLLEGEVAFARTGYQPGPLQGLRGPLEALGLRVEIETRDLTRQGPPRFLGRRIRGRIKGGGPVIAYGAGVADFALLVGYDDGRRCYRLDGPLTEQVGEWLPYDRFPGADARWLAVMFPRTGTPDPVAAVRQAAELAPSAGSSAALEQWIALLESDRPLHAAGHAYWVTALAAARGEAARFWQAAAPLESGAGLRNLEAVAQGYRAVALAFSRAATLFPFPAGGDVESRGGRDLGARALAAALHAEAAALARLAGTQG